MQISQQNQPEQQNIQQNQPVLESSRQQESKQQQVPQPFFKKIQQFRNFTNLHRKDLFAKLDEVCRFLQQNPDFKRLEGKLNATAVILAQMDTIQLIEAMQQLEYHIRDCLEQQEIELKETEGNLQNSQEQLQNSQNDLPQKSLQYQVAEAEVQSKNDTISKLQAELIELNNQYITKKSQLQQFESYPNHIQRNKLIELEKNWIMETNYIKQLFKERTQAKNQAFKVQKVKDLLEARIKELQQVKKELQDAENENFIYLGESISLKKKINSQKIRKENLLENKRVAVFSKELEVAGQIAEEWYPTEKAVQNFLFQVIEKINSNLPSSKLKDVEKIIEQAGEFYNRGGKSARIENIQNQLQNKSHDHQQEI